MESLETLILSGCSNLQRFPEIVGEMKKLLELYLDGTGIEEIPSSIGHLSNLGLLNLKDCSNIVSLPSSIDGCKFLKKLILSGCSKVETLPENLQQAEFLEELDLSGTAIRNPPSFIFQFKNLEVLSFEGCKGPPSKLLSSLFSPFLKRSTDSMSLVLHSLSALSSLYKLNLSDCNLGEGALPSDICCLSSLVLLDLSGNNFISLPTTLGELPKLHSLDLVNCRNLKSLPKFHTCIENVNIDGCASLVEDPIIERCSGCSVTIRGVNCYKLVEKNNALTMLRKHIKVLRNVTRQIEILVPGSEIPEWFSHQTDGSSINIALPPNIDNDSRWVGIAFCCLVVYAFNGDNDDDDDDDDDNDDDNDVGAFSHSVKCYGRFAQTSFFYTDRRQRVKKDHLSIHYISRDCWENEDGECDQIIESITNTRPYYKVKKRGAQIVYEEDLDEMEWWCPWNGGAHDNDDADVDGFWHNVECYGRIGQSSGVLLDNKYRRQRIKKDHLWIRYNSRHRLENKYGECSQIIESRTRTRPYYIVKKCAVQIVYEEDLGEMEQIKEECSSPASEIFDDRE